MVGVNYQINNGRKKVGGRIKLLIRPDLVIFDKEKGPSAIHCGEALSGSQLPLSSCHGGRANTVMPSTK